MKRRGGYMLVEASIVLLVLPVLFFGVYMSVDRATNALGAGATLSELQEEARVVLDRIVKDLRQAAITPAEVGVYPAIYEHDPNVKNPGTGDLLAMMDLTSMPYLPNGFAAGSVALNHTVKNANAISQEIKFKRAVDVDGNGLLTNAATGALEFEQEEVSIHVRKLKNGLYMLERYVDGQLDGFLGKDVRKVCFDVTATDVTISTDAIVVSIFLERKVKGGYTIKTAIEGIVKLRNRSRIGQFEVGI